MKLFFIGSSLYILYLMKVRFRYVTVLFITSLPDHGTRVQANTRPVH